MDNIVSMDFQNVNSLNIRLNLFSGNLLPMRSSNSSFPLFWKILSAFGWLSQFILAIAMVPGSIYVPIEKLLKDGMVAFIVFTELAFMLLRIRSRKNLVCQLIQRLNEILHSADETMRNVVTATLEPVKTPLNFYWSAGVISIIVWSCIPLVLIFEKNLFRYEDYRMPVAFSKQPFSLRIFLLGSLFILITAIYLFLKKVSVDVYMVHLVLMLTAQYRYIALKIARLFQDKSEGNQFQSQHSSGLSRGTEKEIRALCRHHNNVLQITLLLKELLSLNFSLIHVNSVFRFCFIGIMLSTITSTTLWEAISIIMYSTGAIVQLYILCSCVQQLLEASTEITDKAFHENWYLLHPSIKRIFSLLIMANHLECKIATFEKFNLSLPSFMTILNQSYTIALLFLKMK
ncbi:PREDICTED: odorant receptor 49a-like isoform X2 [Vollenhovia emeryi]|uniref:odorant receptor 49a-like isoform X2 n=1 Tax=Vollenhovia emeryi TaxID=411798 RepID=UPI0005F5370E|nr:PREDICTED: odorant receptor 49a-like isoform X2 [Vollenhovia emeryi]